MFKNILVPTDGSPLSLRAIKRAVQLAKEQNARVTGFWVGPEWQSSTRGDSSLTGFVSPSQHSAAVKEQAERVLGPVRKAAAAAGVQCMCLHAEGTYPYEKIVKTADKHGCDLIVMASHGRRGISKLLLGSETAKVLAHSAIPVMVCR
jgi:nucleotide-binding universal stress UspA family protein